MRILIRTGAAAALLMLCGCASLAPVPAMPSAPPARPFDFNTDTLAFINYLEWSYGDQDQRIYNQDKKQDYVHRCFIMSRAARQFFVHARFEPKLPRLAKADDYRPLIRDVLERDARDPGPDPAPVVIPGYANLRQLSTEQENLIKEENGTSFGSYFQRGNWRMIFPFWRQHQENTASTMAAELRAGWPPIIHLVTFPHIRINHAILLYHADETPAGIHFLAYDPNHPEKPMELSYERSTQTFSYAQNDYFRGGEVNVYEIYSGLLY